MSRTITFNFSAIGGTGAGLGRSASGHTLIADRPAGTAGGSGLGFNGGELLAASLGGCFWNDLHYAAQGTAPGFQIERLEARVDLAGEPLRVVRARISAKLGGADEGTLGRIFDAACEGSTIANSLRPTFPISRSAGSPAAISGSGFLSRTPPVDPERTPEVIWSPPAGSS